MVTIKVTTKLELTVVAGFKAPAGDRTVRLGVPAGESEAIMLTVALISLAKE